MRGKCFSIPNFSHENHRQAFNLAIYPYLKALNTLIRFSDKGTGVTSSILHKMVVFDCNGLL